jgi:GAF domain-containing protein
MNWLKESKTKYTLAGIGFGLLFPIIATILDIWQKGISFSLQAAINVQTHNPVHWVVDIAPLVLGVVFNFIGRRASLLLNLNVQLQDTIRQLQEIRKELERQVAERTINLENATAVSQKRARQFEAIVQISRAITSAQNLKELLPHISEAISEQFGFYHVGIFLNDPSDQYTVLAAANSPGGKKMLEAGYQLNIGEQGLVGHVTGTGIPRIAFNVGEDAIFFNNLELPATRSEMALPLRIAEKVIGALDVQSTEPSAVTNEDIASLSILADQVSIAIENARLYESTRKSLEQTEASYRQYVLNEWTRFAREEKLSGFQYVDGNSAPLEVPLDLGESAKTVNDGNIHQSEAGTNGEPAQLAVPVKLRGETIGILHISTQKKPRWADDDIDIAEAVADRIALAIENARLFQSSTNRAARERIVSDISSRISGNIHVKNILQMAAQELSQALNGSDVLIQLQTPKQPAEVEE